AYATLLKEAARICIEAARSHDASTTDAPHDTMAVKDKQPVKDAKPPGKNEKPPAKDKKAAARVAEPLQCAVKSRAVRRGLDRGHIASLDSTGLRGRRIGDLYPAALPCRGLIALAWFGNLDGFRLRRRRRPHVHGARNLDPLWRAGGLG